MPSFPLPREPFAPRSEISHDDTRPESPSAVAKTPRRVPPRADQDARATAPDLRAPELEIVIHAYGREIRVGLVPGADGRTIALSIPAGQNRAEARLDPAVALLLADALRSLAG